MALEDKLPGRLGGRPVHQRTTIKRATITPSAALISLITRILKVALFRSASYSKEVYHLTVGDRGRDSRLPAAPRTDPDGR